jgi:hypothetical protein
MEMSGHHATVALSMGKVPPGTDLLGGKASPRVGLVEVVKTKNPFRAPAGNQTPDIESVS